MEFLKVGNLELSKNECKASEAVLHDIQVLTKTELRNKYKGEASSHSNMKDRCNKGKGILDPRFEYFSCFLAQMGVRSKSKYTLDRINNQDKNYSPENCRWADKKTQNSNKGNNVFLTYNEMTQTIADWAKQTNQKSSKLYKRHSSGWTDEETITGIKKTLIDDIKSGTCWPEQKWDFWESRYQEYMSESKPYISRVGFLFDESKKLADMHSNRGLLYAEEYNPYEDNPNLNFKAETCQFQYEKFTKFYTLAKEYVLHDEKMKCFLTNFKNSKDIERKRYLNCNPPPFTIKTLSQKLTLIEENCRKGIALSKTEHGVLPK